jgi:hypothetical protein
MRRNVRERCAASEEPARTAASVALAPINVLSRTTSGNVGINTTMMYYPQDDLPFGGVGASGMGAYQESKDSGA